MRSGGRVQEGTRKMSQRPEPSSVKKFRFGSPRSALGRLESQQFNSPVPAGLSALRAQPLIWGTIVMSGRARGRAEGSGLC